MTSVLIALSFIALLFSGGILFVSPPGRIANWTNWTLLGLGKHDWIALHVWFSVLFLVVAAFHLVFNWRPMLNNFRNRLNRRVGFRWEWAAALAICGGVFAGVRSAVPPFSSFLAVGDRIKESWDTPRERAPIPHAELLTLGELAQKAGLSFVAASNRLAGQGIRNLTEDMVVRDLAAANARSAQQIYQAMATKEGAAGGGPAAGRQQGRGQGGGLGGGIGWKTLRDYCAENGIDSATALARLQTKGIKADAGQTLREIAVNNGFSKPHELIDLLHGK